VQLGVARDRSRTSARPLLSRPNHPTWECWSLDFSITATFARLLSRGLFEPTRADGINAKRISLPA